MKISDYLKGLYDVNVIPDSAENGNRLFLFDGVNPNIVLNGQDTQDRIMGVYPQWKLGKPAQVAGTGLEAGGQYAYSVRRLIRRFGLELLSKGTTSEKVEFENGKLTLGTAGGLAVWLGLTDGTFCLPIDGLDRQIENVNTAGSNSMDMVADSIADAITSSVNRTDIDVEFNTDHFEIYCPDSLGAIKDSDRGGTQIGGVTYLNGESATYAGATELNVKIVINQYEFLSSSDDVKVFYHIYRNEKTNLSLQLIVDEISQDEICGNFPAWALGVDLVAGESVLHNSQEWRILKEHTSSADKEPTVGSNWELYFREIKINRPDNWIDTTAFVKNDQTIHNGVIWTCKIDNTDEEPAMDNDNWIIGGSVEYIDHTADKDLSQSISYDVAITDTNSFIPPTRYARNYKGRIITGGSFVFENSLATVELADYSKIKISMIPISPVMQGASFAIKGENLYRQIIDIDLVENTLTVDPPMAQEYTDAQCQLFRDGSVLYVSNPLPLNIEGYSFGSEIYANIPNGNITGIATHSGNCYIFRQRGVEMLQGQIEFSLVSLAGNAPACVSHATIADDKCESPLLFYYAGSSVVAISNGQYTVISAPIQKILNEQVDHFLDAFTHGCYNPRTGFYHLWLFEKGSLDRYGVRVPNMMLIYDVPKKQWYPCELMASSSGLWKDINNELYFVIGIAGGVAKFDDVFYDGKDIKGDFTNASLDTDSFTDNNADFPLYDDADFGIVGLPIHILDKNREVVDRKIIKENTETTLTLYSDFEVTLDDTMTYHIGNIRWDLKTAKYGFADSFEFEKKFNRVVIPTEYDGVEETMPVRATISGVGDTGDRTMTKLVDVKKLQRLEIKNTQAGIRSRGLIVEVKGNSTEKQSVLGIFVDGHLTSRSKDKGLD